MEQNKEQKYLLGNIYWAHSIDNAFIKPFIFNREMTKIKDVISEEISLVNGDVYADILKNIKADLQKQNGDETIDIETSAEMYLNYLEDATLLGEAFRILPDNKYYKTRNKDDKPTKRTIVACNNILVDKTDLLVLVKHLKKAYRLVEIPMKSMNFEEFKRIVEESHNF